jgi:hypothetical protein
MHCARDIAQADRIAAVASDVSLGPADHRRFGFRILNRHSICHQREMPPVDLQKADYSPVLPLRHNLCF